MNKAVTSLLLGALWIALIGQVRAEVCSRGTFDISKARPIIQDNVTLLNGIISSPKAANMSNWARLSNPHDETEISFYANSISDGTESAYTTDVSLKKRVIRHSGSQTDSAVVLGFLRLSLLAFIDRPGKKPPSIAVSEIFPNSEGSAVLAKGHLDTFSSSGVLAHQYPIEIEFDVDVRMDSAGNKDRFCLSLDSIVVGKQKVFGWWHDL